MNDPEYDPSDTTGEEAPKKYNSVRASDVQPVDVEWLWPGWLACGTVTILEGNPGVGKSTQCIYMAGYLTRGIRLYGDTRTSDFPPVNVIFAALEDGLAETVSKRLTAAGADMDRVHILLDIPCGTSSRPLMLPADMGILEAMIREKKAEVVFIDAFMSTLHGIKTHEDAAVRSVMSVLTDMAKRCGCAIVLVRHLNKSGTGPAMYRGGGSIAFNAAARSVWRWAEDPQDKGKRILASVKSNLAAKPRSLSAVLEPSGDVARVEFLGESDLTADELDWKEPEERETQLRSCELAIRQILAGGPMDAKEFEQKLKDLGQSKSTIGRARSSVGVVSKKSGYRGANLVSLPFATDSRLSDTQSHPCPVELGDTGMTEE